MRRCPDCGHSVKVTEISSLCHWCHDMKLLAGGWEEPRLAERWTPEELVAMRAQAEARRTRLITESELRKEARRRMKTERERREDGQATLV